MPGPREFVPPEAIPGLVREKVILRAGTFLIEKPGDMEELVDLPAVRSAFASDEYLPYWADIWPAARMLARVILESDWSLGTSAIELGCGLGLAGIAALSKGLHVVFSDYDLTAVAFAARNARLNGYTNFSSQPIDWRDPPKDLQFSLVLGADITYERKNHQPLVETLEAVLAPGGQVWLADTDRPMTPEFLDLLQQRGWRYHKKRSRAGSPGQRRENGTVYLLQRDGRPRK